MDPDPLTDLNDPHNAPLRRYLEAGEKRGVTQAYLAAHRKPWWYLNSKAPPIVSTYMARQPPAFALNPDGLRIVNVVHGLFPKVTLSEAQAKGLVNYLNSQRPHFAGRGRVYHGGLEKFEPSEMEDLPVPPPDQLAAYV